MERRKFLTVPLAALAAPGALLAANAGSAQAVSAPSAVPSITLPADTLKGFGHGGKDALALTQIKSLKLDWYYTWGANMSVDEKGYPSHRSSSKRMRHSNRREVQTYTQ